MNLPDIKPKYRDIEVKDVGTLRMRPLTYGELQKVQELQGGEVVEIMDGALEALKMGVEGKPEEVEAWARAGDSRLVQSVFRRLMELSGRDDAEVQEALGN